MTTFNIHLDFDPTILLDKPPQQMNMFSSSQAPPLYVNDIQNSLLNRKWGHFYTTCFFNQRVKSKLPFFFLYKSEFGIENKTHCEFPFVLFYVKKYKDVKETLIIREPFFPMTSKCGHKTRWHGGDAFYSTDFYLQYTGI